MRPRSDSPRPRSALLAALLVLCAACGTPAPSFLAPDAPPAEGVRRVLLVPMNFDATPPSNALVRGVEIVQADLVAYLGELGLEVESPRLMDALRAWHRVAKKVALDHGDPPEVHASKVAQGRELMARKLLERRQADLVVFATLLVREGSFVGLDLRWDGVTRPVPVQQESAFQEVSRMGGKGVGTSLRVALHGPDGKRFFERYAGLETLTGYTIRGGGAAMGRAMAEARTIEEWPRTDLFEDPALIRETVVLAFQPYLPSEPVGEDGD